MKKKTAIWLAAAAVCCIALVLTLVLTGGSPDRDWSYALNLWEREAVSPVSSFSAALSLTDTDGLILPSEQTYGYTRDAVSLYPGETASFTVSIDEAGAYALLIDLYLDNNGVGETSYILYINGEPVCEKASAKARWRNESDSFLRDEYNNEVMPVQQKIDAWQTEPVLDFLNRTSTPLALYFRQGVNTVEIELIEGSMLLGDCFVVSKERLSDYEGYLASLASAADTAKTAADIYIEAEKPYYKNDTSLQPIITGSVNATPYETYYQNFNAISFGDSSLFETAVYRFTVEDSGYYSIALNHNATVANKTVFYRIEIDGAAPFGELLCYPLFYNSGYTMHTLGENDGGAYRVYLEAGSHTIAITADGAAYADAASRLTAIANDINNIYLDLKRLNVQEGDASRQWNPDRDFPNVVETLTSYLERLREIKTLILGINGSGEDFQTTVYIQSAIKVLDALLKDPRYLPNKSDRLGEGTGSAAQCINSAIADLKNMQIDLDKLYIYPADRGSAYTQNSRWFAFSEGVKAFFHSFASSEKRAEERVVEIWVNRPISYIDIMQSMADTTLTPKTGIKIKFTRMPDEGKLILSSAAGMTPDAVFGISNWLPYELGIREITYDLRRFSDYNEVISQFSPGAIIPLVADGIGLGLPETQDFYVLFYRTDIVEKLNLPIPQTWQEVIDILPELQRNGMNFYIPLSSSTASKPIMTTAPFILQHGGRLYGDDAVSTAIDSEESLAAIKLMTDFYTLYGMELQVSNFFDSFRNGSLPMGVATYETYLKLSYAAPELAGKWAIALSPGTYDEASGEILRWQAGSSTSCIMMGKTEYPDDTWAAIKWWMSAETQARFADNILKTLGDEYLYNSANLEAFRLSPIPDSSKRVILEQWEWLQEYARIPGWYMVERELSNSWNKIVIDGENIRSVIDDAVVVINKEIRRKMDEFGYIKDGVLVRAYKITTMEGVMEWQAK